MKELISEEIVEVSEELEKVSEELVEVSEETKEANSLILEKMECLTHRIMMTIK